MRVLLSMMLLLAIGVVWVFDLSASIRKAPDETISATLLQWSREWPIIPLLVGMTLGHLFWPAK